MIKWIKCAYDERERETYTRTQSDTQVQRKARDFVVDDVDGDGADAHALEQTHLTSHRLRMRRMHDRLRSLRSACQPAVVALFLFGW